MPRWTLADLLAAQARLTLGSVNLPRSLRVPKYRNQTAVYDGRRYGSKLEARYAAHLDLLWHAKEILWYTTQVPFVLEGGVVYRADFLVVKVYGTGNSDFNGAYPPQDVEVVDATGLMTQVKANKLKQVQARYGLTVKIYLRDGSLRPFSDVAVTRIRGPTGSPPGS